MKLEKILNQLNSFEKNSFLKILDGILSSRLQNSKEIDQILAETSKDIKSIDSINVARVFELIKSEFSEFVQREFTNTTSQLDILIDIISRDGNCIMKQDWFARLYEKEVDGFKKKIKEFKTELESDKPNFEFSRLRDYNIYKRCLRVAYFNDVDNNQESKITTDEQSILKALAAELDLSQEEVKKINYSILPIKKLEIDTVINDLKSLGLIFYSKKSNTIYVADEVVSILRKVRGKEVGDKFFRRVLKLFREPQINIICKKHGVEWRLTLEEKIELIISEGISFTKVLAEDMHKDGTNLTDKKKALADLIENSLKITAPIKGSTLEEKIQNLINYFDAQEKDDKVGISIDGYDKLLHDISEVLPDVNNMLRKRYELQEEKVMQSTFLLDFNIKPRDILEQLSSEQLANFVKTKEIKSRGDLFVNILEAYKDSENLMLENYELIGFRDLNGLKENGIVVKEIDLGLKFEELTKSIFEQLGFNVDEGLRKQLNTNKDKVDIIINIGNNDLIVVECKSVKESGYNKFSSVSRQLKSYSNMINDKGFKVVKSLLIAPDFSDDFIKECGIEYELNLSLITASSLLNILGGFRASKLKQFPHNLFMRDVVIQEERVLKAIGK
jgi:hypothetical protein